jgi:hypothetical protein
MSESYKVNADQTVMFQERMKKLTDSFKKGLLDPKKINPRLLRMIRSDFNPILTEIWKIIEIGTRFKNKDDLFQAVMKIVANTDTNKADIEWIKDGKLDLPVDISLVPEKIDLCRLSTKEIIMKGCGYNRDCGHLPEILEGIINLGGMPLTMEMGLQLFLQYKSSEKEMLPMAMNPVKRVSIDSNYPFNHPMILGLENGKNGPWIVTYNGKESRIWESWFQWIFYIPRI